MFKIGDILKTNMDVAETQYEGCRGTTVYTTMMELAKSKRFEIIGDNGSQYVIRHLGTDPIVETYSDKNEIHGLFLKDTTTIQEETNEETITSS